MTEINLYKCGFCGREYLTYGGAEFCEDSHKKDVEISSIVYDSGNCKGMPSEIRLQNKEHTKLATYKIIDVIER